MCNVMYIWASLRNQWLTDTHPHTGATVISSATAELKNILANLYMEIQISKPNIISPQ